MIRIENASAVKAQLLRYYSLLSKEQVQRAIVLAFNDAQRKGRVFITKRVRQAHPVKAGQFKRQVKLRTASKKRLEATLTIGGKALPIDATTARQTKQGIRVSVYSGQSRLIRGAFFAVINGRKRPMARGKYQGGQFQFRHKRIRKTGPDLPINTLFTLSPALMVGNKRTEIVEQAVPIITDTAAERLGHFFDKISKGIVK